MLGPHTLALGALLISAALAIWESLATERIADFTEALIEEDDRDGGRLFDTWVPQVEAADNEVMARITGDVIAADIVELDQKARVIQPEPIALEKTVIPKIKHGIQVTEAMMDLLMRIEANIATARDRQMFDNWVVRQLRRLLNGIRDRRELMLAGMLVDDWDYDRWGIKASNVSWGMPSALKITVSPAWSNTGSATPVADIEDAIQTAEDDYGESYDTIVFTRAAFDEMVATDEFKARAQAWFQLNFVSGTFPTANRNDMQGIAQNVLSRRGQDGGLRPMNIIIYNKRTKTEDADGGLTNVRFLPDDAVILTDSANIGDAMAWDFANATVLETMPGVVPALIGGFDGGMQSGPVGYATAGDAHGNPPGQLLWAVQRGFPRKQRLSANAVLRT